MRDPATGEHPQPEPTSPKHTEEEVKSKEEIKKSKPEKTHPLQPEVTPIKDDHAINVAGTPTIINKPKSR